MEFGMTAPKKAGHRQKRWGNGKLLAVAVTSLIVLGLSMVVGTPNAEACDTACPVDNASIYSPGPSPVPPVTIIKEVPTTVTSYVTTVEYVPTTVTETETTTATTTETTTELVPTTVTVPTTETATVTSLIPTTETVTVDADSGGIATSTENVTDRVTETENVLETVQTTEVAATTVNVTRFNATAVNTQTGQTPAVTTTAAEASPGGALTLSGDGYTPGEPIEIWLHSDPVLLDTVNADANGQFQTAITIPIDTPVGQHTINVVGVTCGIETVVPLTVVAPSDSGESGDTSGNPEDALWSAAGTRTLSHTGVNTTMAGTAATLLIGAGIVLVIAARRRTGTAISMARGGRHRE
jgi:hypothetical protein